MSSVLFFNRRFTPRWFIILITLAFFSLFVRLGFWQMTRAEEKEKILKQQETQAALTPISWNASQKEPTQYQKIKTKGTYLPYFFYLDNQHFQHQFGYHVLSPLQLAGSDNKIIIVDRGWVKGDITRQSLPKVNIPSGWLNVSGAAYYPSKKLWSLGPNLEARGKRKYIIEHFDAKQLSEILQMKVYPFIIRLSKKESHGFIREWAVISMPPQRHYAYALQWFAMAAAILIIFVVCNIKKKDEDV